MQTLRIFLEMIKFKHTLFALPFAYAGALLTAQRVPSLHDLFWITVAMAGARTAAMSFNRLADRHFDAANPRTANRALPQNQLSLLAVSLYTLLSLLLLALAAFQLSSLAVKLLLPVVFCLTFYSYTKRFTWLCHLFLGATLGLAPLCAWAAIADTLSLPALSLWGGVLFWVAGFDIIYACSDMEFDRQAGLYSIPACFGLAPSLRLAAFFHVFAAGFFVITGWLLALGPWYWAALGVAAFPLWWQHHLVSPADLIRSQVAFFHCNSLLSLLFFAGVLLDVLTRHGF